MRGAEYLNSQLASPIQFNTTHWSVVMEAGKASPQSSVALEKLCRTYWYPIYAFARRKGYQQEDAKDLTQQFFARLLERNDFETVDPRKGRFRTFLLTSFTHFLLNELDRARAAKRGGGKQILSLDELKSEQLDRCGTAEGLAPDQLFDLRWALTILERALLRLRDELTEAGKVEQFQQLKKYLTEDAGPEGYGAAAQALGMPAASVAVMVHRLRARYRELVRAEVAQTVRNPLELEEEMRHLAEVLTKA